MKQALFIFALAFCLSPWSSSALALLVGVALALSVGNPYSAQTRAWTPKLLSWAVIGMGAGMNLITVAHVGAGGLVYTVVTISLAFAAGLTLGRFLHVEENTSTLITVGTAICGGSAIAAVSGVLRARPHEISVSLGIVFLLNALALFVFPVIGHAFAMTETQFGLWSALAIHDTSSVVGATLSYGPHALEVGTTVKLARALWIVPVTLLFGAWSSRGRAAGASAAADASTALGASAERRSSIVGLPSTNERILASRDGRLEQPQAPVKLPWFILGFLVTAALVTFVPAIQPVGLIVNKVAQRALIVTLFLIGTNLSRENIVAVGFRPFAQGIALWLVMAATTLLAITKGWIA